MFFEQTILDILLPLRDGFVGRKYMTMACHVRSRFFFFKFSLKPVFMFRLSFALRIDLNLFVRVGESIRRAGVWGRDGSYCPCY